MLSSDIKTYAHELWETVRPTLNTVGDELQEKIDKYQGDMRILLELSCGSLPASDLASVDFQVIVSYAEHSLKLREISPYCKDISEDIFLHCVFYPRINSEDLVDCRGFFYEKLKNVVAGLSGTEAALAVNRWCGENMTYEMTDTRSINPLTAYSCGLGRCGEESTFGVTALRSVGIPARQIYVPWWSHCDDNHAWVECYVDGHWHFLGACEPEPALDRGWFVNASSRAMVICSRNYFSYIGEGLKSESLVQKKGISLNYNQIRRYAETAETKIFVKNESGVAAKGSWVRFYVENMAELACIAALQSDENGEVTIESGLGSMLIEAEYEGKFSWEKITVREDSAVTLYPNLDTPPLGEDTWDFTAPETGHKNKSFLSPEEQAQKTRTLRAVEEKRIQRINSYWLSKYETADTKMQEVFRTAAGHAEALWDFYCEYGNEAKNILMSLKPKDWRDCDPSVLVSHIEGAKKFKTEDNNFIPYIQCPRIGYELLTSWRCDVENALSQDEKTRFKAHPEKLWSWICSRFKDGSCRYLPVLWFPPGAALKLHAADLKGRRLLFVAIMRTLGVAARLNPVDGRPEFLQNSVFRAVEADTPEEPMAKLHIKTDASMVYAQSWGLSRWVGSWQSLDLEDADLEDLELPLGIYRLHTVNRLPNGNQLISYSTFELKSDVELIVKKRKAAAEQLLASFKAPLPIKAEGLELQFYLEPGAEPTEHSLNELIAAKSRVTELMAKGLSIRFIIPNSEGMENRTLIKTLNDINGVKTQVTDFNSPSLENLARALYLEPGQWPLICLSDGETAYYGHAGYAVGSVGLAMELSQLILNK